MVDVDRVAPPVLVAFTTLELPKVRVVLDVVLFGELEIVRVEVVEVEETLLRVVADLVAAVGLFIERVAD